MAGVTYVDLHTHTTASDGLHAPADNVRMAKAAGLTGIAITDHDTVAGIEEALEEGKRLGVIVVPGVEISTVLFGVDIHILGYYIDHKDDVFLARLESLRKTRELRNDMLIAKLQELGVAIGMADVLRIAASDKKQGETVGRPHIAQAMVERGYVASVREAFDRYLGSGGAAYVNPPRIHPAEAIAWIREAGGKAVLAHPGIYGSDEWVEEIVSSGIDGIEVYHSDHTPAQELTYAKLAVQHRLIVTAGSDFHGSRGGELFHGAIGNRRIEANVLAQLQGK